MRNARHKKVREYRKAVRSAKGTVSLSKLFDKLYPDATPNEHPLYYQPIWHSYEKSRHDWFRKIVQEPVEWYCGLGNADADFRRDLNRLQRVREKQAIRNAIAHGDDWDDFCLPRRRRNANWLYW